MNVCETYDFIVIGGGSAGYAAARTANELGAKVAVVDDAEELGGLCILRGCMPSKTLIYSSRFSISRGKEGFWIRGFKTASGFGFDAAKEKEIIAEFADYRAAQLRDGRFSFNSLQGWVQPIKVPLSLLMERQSRATASFLTAGSQMYAGSETDQFRNQNER